jgi:hypothetical protein
VASGRNRSSTIEAIRSGGSGFIVMRMSWQQIAHSSVLTRTTQQIGGSFGTAVLAVILQSAAAGHGGNLPTAFGIAFWWSVGFSLLAVLLSFWLPGAQRAPARPETAEARPVPAAR